MKTDSEDRRAKKAPKTFDWTDRAFLDDRTFYRGLDFSHFWSGIGLLMQRLQGLRESLDVCQGMVAGEHPELPPFRLDRTDAVPKPAKVRESALGEVFSLRFGGWEYGIDSEIGRMVYLAGERRFFADEFFMMHAYDDGMLNGSLTRLKKAISCAERMETCYEGFVTEHACREM